MCNTIKCEWCNNDISKYNMSNHLKTQHQDNGGVDKYIETFGEFRKNKLWVKKNNRKISKIKCEICDNEYSIVGIYTHLRDTHKLTPDEYVKLGYSEYRPNQLKLINSTYKNQCKICKCDNFLSHQQLAHHIKKQHDLSMLDYVKKYIFNNTVQTCKCGCGIEISYLIRPPYRTTYINGHAPNGMTGRKHNAAALNKMSDKAMKRYMKYNKKGTGPENKFEQLLIENNIPYTKQVKTKFGVIDFLVDDKYYVEIDGEYWHPLSLNNLNIQLIQSAKNDKYKNDNIPNLIRIRENNIPDTLNINDLPKLNEYYKYPTKINYYDVIIDKLYFKKYIDAGKKSYLEKHSFLLLKFLRNFQITLPEYKSKETLNKVIDNIPFKIQTLNNGHKTFNNNCSNLGVSYLKQSFKSYWKSSYKGKMPPVDVWNDDYILHKIINYRIGVNSSNEIYDFNLHQIIRGISALRYTISFFKPVLAASIYKHFIDEDIENPTVIDPCSGFAGRLLGFKSVYPNGVYIGIEPNIETYNELVELAKNFTNVKLYNCKFEDFNINDFKYDLIFTSIPYYDLETYSNPVEYSNFNEWVDNFLLPITKLPNSVINVPESLKDYFTEHAEYYIKHNTNHFNKNQNSKVEYLYHRDC